MDEIEYTKEVPDVCVKRLSSEEGKRIWLLGGCEIISQLCNENAVEELVITTVPIVLGDGIPFFQDLRLESHWEIVSHNFWPNSIFQITFKKKSDSI